MDWVRLCRVEGLRRAQRLLCAVVLPTVEDVPSLIYTRGEAPQYSLDDFDGDDWDHPRAGDLIPPEPVTLPEGHWQLWQRRDRRRPWKAVCEADTPAECWRAAWRLADQQGDFCLLPAGRTPPPLKAARRHEAGPSTQAT
jgi:hypothetical protein